MLASIYKELFFCAAHCSIPVLIVIFLGRPWRVHDMLLTAQSIPPCLFQTSGTPLPYLACIMRVDNVKTPKAYLSEQ